jgi:hypothetical protein
MHLRACLGCGRGGSSDPYVILSCGAKRERTKTKKKTLQPHWDEAFAFEVQPGLGGIELTVYDEDNIGSDSFLGSLVVRLDDLPENSDVVQSFALQARGLDPDKVCGWFCFFGGGVRGVGSLYRYRGNLSWDWTCHVS